MFELLTKATYAVEKQNKTTSSLVLKAHFYHIQGRFQKQCIKSWEQQVLKFNQTLNMKKPSTYHIVTQAHEQDYWLLNREPDNRFTRKP